MLILSTTTRAEAVAFRRASSSIGGLTGPTSSSIMDQCLHHPVCTPPRFADRSCASSPVLSGSPPHSESYREGAPSTIHHAATAPSSTIPSADGAALSCAVRIGLERSPCCNGAPQGASPFLQPGRPRPSGSAWAPPSLGSKAFQRSWVVSLGVQLGHVL